MIAPIIPGLTDHEILPIAEAAVEAGARSIGYTVVRLNGDLAEIFSAWAREHYPARAECILNRIRDRHDGKLNDSEWGRRQRGAGRPIAEAIGSQVQLARRLYLGGSTEAGSGTQSDLPPYNTSLFDRRRPGQHPLF